MKHAKDIMTSLPKTVYSSDDFETAWNAFREYDLHYLPVITPDGKLLGLLSDFVIVNLVLHGAMGDLKSLGMIIHHQEALESPVTVFENDSIEAVAKALLQAGAHRVMVLSSTEKLVGIISPKDFINFLLNPKANKVSLKKALKAAQVQITTLDEHLQSASNALSNYQALLEQLPYMVFVMDESTKITIANKQAHDHLGYKPKQLIGKTITDLFPRSEVPQAIQRHQELIEKGKPSFTYSSLLTAKGEKIRVDLAGSAARNANGKLIGTMIVAREIDSEALLRALNGI